MLKLIRHSAVIVCYSETKVYEYKLHHSSVTYSDITFSIQSLTAAKDLYYFTRHSQSVHLLH